MMKKVLSAVLLLLLVHTGVALKAATVDTANTYSASMKKNIKAVVIKPEGYSNAEKYPVMYLLHGYGDIYSGWIQKVPAIKELSDNYKFIIVCPDGNVSSWYFDSPVDPAWKYETYVANELVSYIDKNYSTIKDRKGRAITGLSMGGHGALYLAFRHQDVFGAAGSMSGGVDIRPFPLNWSLSERLGKYSDNQKRWDDNTVLGLVHLLTPNSLKLIIDCGTEDFFYNVNTKLHEQLLYSNIPHDYITRPGGHTWQYWANSVQYQALFFNNFFKNAK